jgi:ATP-binding cassette, subfamily B, bacterial
MHADRIFVLEQGRIVETGTNLDLLNEDGFCFTMLRQKIGERKIISLKNVCKNN